MEANITKKEARNIVAELRRGAMKNFAPKLNEIADRLEEVFGCAGTGHLAIDSTKGFRKYLETNGIEFYRNSGVYTDGRIRVWKPLSTGFVDVESWKEGLDRMKEFEVEFNADRERLEHEYMYR